MINYFTSLFVIFFSNQIFSRKNFSQVIVKLSRVMLNYDELYRVVFPCFSPCGVKCLIIIVVSTGTQKNTRKEQQHVQTSWLLKRAKLT